MREIEPAASREQKLSPKGRHAIVDGYSASGRRQDVRRHQSRRSTADDRHVLFGRCFVGGRGYRGHRAIFLLAAQGGRELVRRRSVEKPTSSPATTCPHTARMLAISRRAACGVRAMNTDNRSNDRIRAGAFLRSRWQQWLIGRGGVKASYLAGQLPADSVVNQDAAGTKARSAAKNADNAASRNAQNCTFEVF